MIITVECMVQSATFYDFTNDKGERVCGSKIIVSEQSTDQNCKGLKLSTYNAPLDVFQKLPQGMPAKLKLNMELKGKNTTVVSLA